VRADEARLERGHEEAHPSGAQPLEAPDGAGHGLERGQAVAEARRVLEPAALGMVADPRAQPGRGLAVGQAVELLRP
jgi:hypothetical protein